MSQTSTGKHIWRDSDTKKYRQLYYQYQLEEDDNATTTTPGESGKWYEEGGTK